MGTPETEIGKEYTDNMDMEMRTKLRSDLSIYALQGEWKEVVEMYRTFEIARDIEIIGGRGTALHVAVNDGRQDIVEVLFESIKGEEEQLRVLRMRDERGDTPLHLAASKGFKGICKLIIEGPNKEERNKLVTIKNDLGETPLFLAALTWQKQTFAYLFQNYRNSEANQTNKDVIDLQVLMRDDGDTILHSAIRREFFDLAVIIIHHCPLLHDIQNINGFTPLKLLANTPSAFSSGSRLSWWRRIIYHCMEVKDLDVQRTIERYLNDEPRDPELRRLPPNYLTCYEFFTVSELNGLGSCNILPSEKANPQMSKMDEHFISMPLPNADYETSQSRSPERKPVPEIVKEDQNVLPPNYVTCEQLVKFAYLHALGIHGAGVKVIRKIKKKHIWASQLLSALMKNPFQAYMGSGGKPIVQLEDEDETDPFSAYTHQNKEAMKTKQNQASKEKDPAAEENIDRSKETTFLIAAKSGKVEIVKEAEDNIDWSKETALLIAAKNGIVEIVNVILSLIPSALHDTTSDKKNVFLVAIRYRQPLVVRALLDNLSKQNIKKNLLQAVDNHDNTVLHLAADTVSNERPWKIPGSAMQMMWDIKWFEYIKELVPEHFIFRRNKKEKTSVEIFNSSHKDLVKESSEWLKETSESCSVVAALVAGVSFATSSTVPGGTEKGKPALEGQPAFDLFAISALIGLCFAVTALIMFLTILTSRKRASDFRRNLPLKLLLGLTSLFTSIVALFVSFCAGHFFVLTSKSRQFVFPIYVATCLPVSFYAVAQFPLYLDLLGAILRTIPQPGDKNASDL